MKTIANWFKNGDRPLSKALNHRFNRPPRQALGIAALIVVTLLWGTTFVVVKDTVKVVPPSVMISLRFLISAVCLLPVLLPTWRHQVFPPSTTLKPTRKLWFGGAELGLLLLAGFATQTIGLQYTSVHRSAFVTALNVFFVPMFLGLLGHRISPKIWLASLLALGGVGLLSYDVTPPNVGDLWTLGTAIAYGLYIIRLGHYSQKYSALALGVVQLWTTAVVATIWAVVEYPTWFSGSQLAQLPWGELGFLAIACTTAPTLLQAWGQQRVSAAQSAVLFTLEPVWASLFAWVLLGELLGLQGLLGAALIVSAMFVTVPFPSKPSSAASAIAWFRRRPDSGDRAPAAPTQSRTQPVVSSTQSDAPRSTSKID